MNIATPIADVVPGHRGAVLLALLRLREPVTGRELAAQAAVPPATTARIVDDLANAGLVDLKPAGRAITVVLNRRHLAVPALEELAAIRARLIEVVRSAIARWDAAAAAGWLFGSAARGDGDRDSDIDIVLVARREPTDIWERQVGELSELVTASTGNVVQILDYSRSQFRELVGSGSALIRALGSEGIELVDSSSALLRTR